MVKITDLQNLTKEELVEKESQLKKQLMQLRFDAKLGKLEKHSTMGDLRRDIARVLTVMNQQKATAVKPQSKIKTGSAS